ncbi:MAG: glycosyltransferase family 2 protein [Bacteriovoracia bacterium]
MKIWIVSPCYFDVKSFERVRQEVLASSSLDRSLPEIRFVLIDDSARQDAEVVTLRRHSDVFVITPPYNLGHQAALVFALRTLRQKIAPQDIVVTMDSDGEDRPADVPILVRSLMQNPSELHRVSIARRTQRKETLLFKLFYSCFKTLFLFSTGTIVRNGNFVAFRGWFLENLIFHPHFDQCYASSFISLPLTITFVPLPRGNRFEGKSKMGYFGLVTHGIRMLMPFSEKIAVRGLVASSLGFVFFGALWKTIPAFVCLMFIGMFALLFATFSQTKARSLRGLVEMTENTEPRSIKTDDLT